MTAMLSRTVIGANTGFPRTCLFDREPEPDQVFGIDGKPYRVILNLGRLFVIVTDREMPKRFLRAAKNQAAR